jgi:hypothetical protein
MANEIRKSITTSWTKGGAQIIVSTAETLDQTGEQSHSSVQVIGGTSEALVFGDVVAPAHVIFKNINKKWSELTTAEKLSAGNVQATYEDASRVYIGTTNPTTSADAVYSLYPGSGVQFFQETTLTWYACKATNSVNLLVTAFEK